MNGTNSLGAAHADEANGLLRAVPAEEYQRMLAELRPVRLDFKQILVEPGAAIDHVYFVRDGVASVLAVQNDGTVEVGLVGREGFVGLPHLFGVDTMPFRVIIQAEGEAWRMGAEVFRRLVRERPALLEHMLRYAAYYLEQVSQSVACNRLHTIEERCARWLLMTDDRVTVEHFQITHEFISRMLGVRRAGVTVTLALLQRAGIIRYARGRVIILDRGRLEDTACDCYRINRDAQRRLLGGLSGSD